MKSASPHEIEEARARRAASMPREASGRGSTHVRLCAGAVPWNACVHEAPGGRPLSHTARDKPDADHPPRRRARHPPSGGPHRSAPRACRVPPPPDAGPLARGRAARLPCGRARQGRRPDALRFLYLLYADNVYGYVCSIVRDEHEAEDVTQQIFAKLLTALDRYEPRVVPFSAWILRVAQNAAIDHVRTRRPVPTRAARDDRGAPTTTRRASASPTCGARWTRSRPSSAT